MTKENKRFKTTHPNTVYWLFHWEKYSKRQVHAYGIHQHTKRKGVFPTNGNTPLTMNEYYTEI
jgi:hypothetical protein